MKHTCKIGNALNVGKTVIEKPVALSLSCLRSLFSSRAVSGLSLLCMNHWNKRNAPNTLVPYVPPRRHERVVLETRNLLPYDVRTSQTNLYGPRGEGLMATRTQLIELWFDIVHKSVIPISDLTFVLISTPVSGLSFFCMNRWNKPNSPKTFVQNATHPRGKLSYNGA